MSDDAIELFCLLEGDSAVFPVTIAIDDHVSNLKKKIHQDGIDTTIIPVLAKDLTLWKASKVP
jgi:hypothetical protein